MTFIQQLLPDLVDFTIEQVMLEGDQVIILAQSQTVHALCPACAHPSSRVHSRYTRRLADLPWGGQSVRLVIQVRRFFCQQQTCSRKTFAETIPTLAKRYGRRTIRLKEALEQFGLALGGEATARLTGRLKMFCSPDTLLRMLRCLPDKPVEPPRVVSLDDWSWRKGHRYGTLICDLERHRRLDVLPDRDVHKYVRNTVEEAIGFP
ncbi:transposase family protein [Dictyobacter formicarum]|uniref:Transposase IS204/IS1001/IS1096/IS1165 zinc-finger domain-containing protein n=1 Tax=Dictyobacter formicarum TaxID=2778368 RepID=A0ABQ3VPE1_9CHLR|nr:transposase family protein [Dictyobacter formicarum]GHO87559.1 hypothetical protein KSZ_55650 [Dictyobacter formicarum]